MDGNGALSGYRCVACGDVYEPDAEPGRCADCGGVLEAEYDLDAVRVGPPADCDDGAPSGFLERSGLGALLPVALDTCPQYGWTPLLDAPSLAAELGVAGVAIKAEGCNPTGSIADREMAPAVAAARDRGAEQVALPTTGSGGRAAAAAAAAAGLSARVFVPSRATFVDKAMINVHGGDMTVVEGRYPDAVAAFESAAESDSPRSLAPFDAPYRQEGVKALAYEIAAERGWRAPDRVIVPTGQVTALVGIHRGFSELAALGLTDRVPTLVAAQAEGCAPLVAAVEADADEPVRVGQPDTVCGHLEVPEPAGGRLALRALSETGGTAIAVADDDALAAATDLSAAGVPASATGGAAVASARADRLGEDEEVVLVDPLSADREADLLRSYLGGRGR